LATAACLAGYLPLLVTSRGETSAEAAKARLAPLELQLPQPQFSGTPPDFKTTEYMEKYSDEPRPPLLVPAGVTNVARGKKVTCSDPRPLYGTPDLVTDGDKEASDEGYLQMHRKTQFVQIDLEAAREIYAIAIWHAHHTPHVYHDVVVQLADDRDFTANVRTVFNNDYDNSSGLGVGRDKEYWEDSRGKVIPVNGLRARYLRAYSKESTFDALNRCTEIEVYALPGTGAQAVVGAEGGDKGTGTLRTAKN
jgi:hypothetical protein